MALKEGEDAANQPHDPDAILGAGIQDVMNSMLGDFKLNDILQWFWKPRTAAWASAAPR